MSLCRHFLFCKFCHEIDETINKSEVRVSLFKRNQLKVQVFLYLTSQVKLQFHTSKVKKSNVTIDLLSLPRDPSFDTSTPSFAGCSNLSPTAGFRPGTKRLKVPVFWARNAITLHFGGYTKTNFIFEFPVSETQLHTFLGTLGYFWADSPNQTAIRLWPGLLYRPGTGSAL